MTKKFSYSITCISALFIAISLVGLSGCLVGPPANQSSTPPAPNNPPIDNSFEGEVIIPELLEDFFQQIRTFARQSDGKIIVAGEVLDSLDYGFGVARYLPNGSLDTTFNGTGYNVVSTDIYNEVEEGNFAQVVKVIVQSDDKIIVGGHAIRAGILTLMFMRFNADGTLDTSFGREGVVATSVGEHTQSLYTNDTFQDMIVQDDDKFIVGSASTYSNYGLMSGVGRFNPDGTIDGTFQSTGFFTSPWGSHNFSMALAWHSNQSVYSVGYLPLEDGQNHAILARLSPELENNGAYILNGYVISEVPGTKASKVAVLPNGQIIVAGTISVGLDNEDLMLQRYNADLTLDTSFGVNGLAQIAVSTYNESVSSLLIRDSGYIMLAGASGPQETSQSLLVRFTSNGLPDSNYGTAGAVLTTYEGTPATAVTMMNDNDGLIVGTNLNGSFVLTRYIGP